MNTSTPFPTASAQLKTILIIDDDVHLAAALALGLENKGYRALHAANADIGWEMAHAHLPDLILSDIDMPGKDGRRLLQDMRADPELADRQFVLMTGKVALGNQRTVMDLGADDLLMKPFTLEELARCIATRLRRAELSRRLDESTLERIGASLRDALPHEFFTPLACILGLTELLQLDLDKIGPDEIRRDLGEIHHAGQRLLRTLRNYLLLLELERPGAARATTVLEPEIVNDALNAGAMTAAERHQRTGDIVTDLRPPPVRATPADLRTIVEELVDNALNFSRTKTSVRVRAWREAFVFHLEVADAGRGMAPQQLEHLRAFAGRPRTLTQPQGLGLGLVLVRRLVQHLGGEIHLDSHEGRGTTARVTLPVPAA